LFEAPPAEKYGTRYFGQTAIGGKSLHLCFDSRPIFAVDHAEQIVGPNFASTRTAVTKGNTGVATQLSPNFANPLIRNIKGYHGVSPVTQFSMPYDHTESFDDAAFDPVLQFFDHRFLVESYLPPDFGIRPRHER
jgi:hypothetical protein